MQIEYKRNDTHARFWVFSAPEGVEVDPQQTAVLEVDFETSVQSLALVDRSVLVVYKYDVQAVSAKSALNTIARHLGFAAFGTPLPLDRFHLETWGFYTPEADLVDLTESLLGLESELVEAASPEAAFQEAVAQKRTEVDARKAVEVEQREKAAELQAADKPEEAQWWIQKAEQTARKLRLLSVELDMLAPGVETLSRALQGPEPTASSTDVAPSDAGGNRGGLRQSLDQAAQREDAFKAKVDAHKRSRTFRWFYGAAPDSVTCYVKPTLPVKKV